MPTYNYYCSNCNLHFSYFQKMSESPFSECEKCGSQIKRLITGGTGLIFKGSGFYLTDYKTDPKSENSLKDNDSNAKSKKKVNKEKPSEKSIQKKETKSDE